MLTHTKSWMKRAVETAVISLAAIGLLNGSEAFAQESPEFEIGELIYENPLDEPEDVEDWVIESSKENHPIIRKAWKRDAISVRSGVNFLLWCPKDFPDNIAVSWEFKPKVDKGLAMFWIAATGEDGKDLFDPSLDERTGGYSQYRDGDINALHIAYFRRNHPEPGGFHEVNFQTCSLRKTTVEDTGPKMARSADPIPSASRARRPYKMQVIKYGPYFRFSINGLTLIDWKDDGEGAPVLEGGKIGFRQMADLVAEYSNLKVHRVSKVSD